MCSTTEKSWFDPRPGQEISFCSNACIPLWRIPEPPINGHRGLFPAESGRTVKLTTHFKLVQGLIIFCEALPTFRMYLHGQTTSP